MDKIEATKLIRDKAFALGFSACGFAPSESVDPAFRNKYAEWLRCGKQASMAYLDNHFEKRMDPRLLVEGSKSIIVVALNYYPSILQNPDAPQVSYYAYGEDYHTVVKDKLAQLFQYIHTEIAPIEGRMFTDSAPVWERYWAWKAGLGWIGKSMQLIIPNAGTYFFLGELIIDLELDYATPQQSRCGSCSRCIDNCPTKALIGGVELDANRCLSYLTIENRGDIPSEFEESLGNRVYGCDTCQLVCPWNKFAKPNETAEFKPKPELLSWTKEFVQSMSREEYNRLFKGSAIKRAKFEGWQRNAALLSKK